MKILPERITTNIAKDKDKINLCCSELKDAYYQYQTLRVRDTWPACLDNLEWDELRPIFMLIESLIEKKCMLCRERPVVLDYVLKKLRGGNDEKI